MKPISSPILALTVLLAATSTPAGAQGKPAVGVLAPPPAAAKPSAAGALAEPRWPQKFDLGPGERHAFGFFVGQPGRILVTVQWQGVPLVVSLVKPGGGVVDKPGNSSATLDYTATADDIKKGAIWSLRLRASQELKPASATVHDRPVKLDVRSVATGSVTIQHPPADMQRAQAEFNLQTQKANAQKESLRQQSQAKQTPASSANLAAQRRLTLSKDTAARHGALLEQIRGKIPVESHQLMSQQIALRAQGKASAIATPPITKSGAAIKPLPLGVGVKGTAVSRNADTGTSGSGGTVKPVGSSQAATVATAAINALSVSRGDPGTPLLISGSGFSDTPGEVHFIVANGTDLVAPVTTWTDAQVLTQVPYKDGVPAYNGYVYVKRADGVKTSLQGFGFLPPLDVAVLGFPIASTSGAYQQDAQLYDSHAPALWFGLMQHHTYCLPWGLKGDDEYYLQTHLKNGWTLDSAAILANGHPGPNTDGSAGAYITDARVGTDSPYVKVHWWVDANSYVSYDTLQVTIKGPKGLAYQ